MAAVVAVEFNLVPLPVDFLESSEARVNFVPSRYLKTGAGGSVCATKKENDTREEK